MAEDFGSLFHLRQRCEVIPNVLPIEVSSTLTDKYATKVDAILRTVRERFHDDKIFSGADPEISAWLQLDQLGTGDRTFLEG